MSQVRPRIAFLLSSLKFGGGERVALNLARALDEQGYDIDFVLMSAVGELLEQASLQFNVVDLRCSRSWKLPWLLARYLRSAKPVALISSFWKLNLCSCLARIASPAKNLALWEHSPPSRSRNSPTWLYGLTASVLYRLATCIVAVSDGVAADITNITRGLGGRIVTIYNAIPDAAQSTPRRQRLRRRILWVGRLDEPKNPRLMIDVMGQLRGRLNLSLFVVGDGPQRDALHEKVRNDGLRGSVRLLGFQSDPRRLMARADLLVLTSDREGLPTVLIEGLYAGLALVSTDCASGVHEILSAGRFGSIVGIGDADGLAHAIFHELADPPSVEHQRCGARRFDPSTIARQFVTALDVLP